MDDTLTIGIPKGSLQESTLGLFSRAGFSFQGSERSLWLSSNDPEIKPVLLRPQEIPIYVARGELDCGLSGLDWITERKCNDRVHILADLCYSKRSFRPVRWVLAVAENSPYKTVEDLKQNHLRISTELEEVTKEWLSERGMIDYEVNFSWGATEAKIPIFADAIVECTETGESLLENGLRILDTVFVSTTQFLANKDTYRHNDEKRSKMEGIAILLKSCLLAETKVGIQVQASSECSETLISLIPDDASFSVLQGQNGDVLIEIISEKDASRGLIPVLARSGAKRISVAPIGLLYNNE